jgi:hypothetical protein
MMEDGRRARHFPQRSRAGTPGLHTLSLWCREQDLNLHAFWALDPKSNASANSAIPAFRHFNRCAVFSILSYRGRCLVHRTISMGKRCSQLLAIFLLIGVATVSSAGQPATMTSAVAVPPAGCHQHGAKPPASVPVSYRCCQGGHDSAILQTFTTDAPAHMVSVGDSTPASVTSSPQICFESLMISSPDPPHNAPLRV